MKEWGWLCRKGGSLHRVPKHSLCLGPAVRGNQPYLSAGLSWAPTRCVEYDRFVMQRRLHSSLFLPNLFLFETETDDDFVFYLDKENKIWNGIVRKKCVYFHADRNPVVYKHGALWGGLMLWSIECLSPSICALCSHWLGAARCMGYGMNAKGERCKKSEQVSNHSPQETLLEILWDLRHWTHSRVQNFPFPTADVITPSPKEWR